MSREQIIWGGNYFDLPPARNFIVWDKKMSEDFSMAMAEYAWVSLPGNAKIYRQQSVDAARFHPTQKPVKLYQWILSRYAKPGWRILDTHAGSFTLAAACYEPGIPCVCIELDEDYYRAGVERLRGIARQGLLGL